jgi:WD40 repeat protein/serine/threonine protein kinase
MNERDIFIAALQKEAQGDRRAYLDEACRGDNNLRRGVEALLKVHDRAGSFLESPVADLVCAVDDPLAVRPGTVIGPYKLLEQIGEGGFGVVYLAEQQQPVRRKVALKVLKPGMDTKQVAARFEAERQALALMDHTNIARVLDAGATDPGRPYFVMELVRGIPITQFCDDNRLTPRERLELFVTVCQAVQHAHQKGIIHRDLKPSNVLVTLHDGAPLVKVIDFGIAKALGQERLTDKTLCTGLVHMIGTPLYMSPEQAEMSGQDVDTRTDIYALGVLLYELLTGTTPFDKERLRETSYDEMRRIIREEEPVKPSTRISTLGQAATTVSANRKSEPRRLSQFFRGELDWIVMKALEKDRNRRYETASSFAADVQRYLHDEPVQACPPSAVYRFRKFATRNKTALVTASAAALVVLLGVAGLAASNILIMREKAQTDAARDDLQRTLYQLQRTLYYERIARAERESSANNLKGVEELLDACPADLRGWEWFYLKRLRLEGIHPLEHSAAVLSAVFSPDGRWIASGSQDGRIQIWDARMGRRLLSVPAHQNHVRSVAFSPDGRRLASASWDKTVKIWDLDPLRAGATDLPLLKEYLAPANHVVFSPDGTRLASVGGKNLRIWDAITGDNVLDLPGHGCPAFSPDGQAIAGGDGERTVRIWDAKTGRERLAFPGHATPIQCVVFSRDGKLLASAASDGLTRADGEIKVWDVQTGQESLTLRGHVGDIHDAAVSPDGRRLASAGFDSNVKLWDLRTGQEVLTLRGHRGGVRSVAFSSDGTRLVSAGRDGTIRVWDATPLQGGERQEVCTLRAHAGGVRAVAFSPDGQRLASAGDDATILFWDLKRGLAGFEDPPVQTLPGGTGLHVNVVFSRDGRLFAWGGGGGHAGGTLRIWDAITWKELDRKPSTLGAPVAFSPDSQLLAAVSDHFIIEVRDVTTDREVRRLPGHSWAMWEVAFSPHPGQNRLASASNDGTVRIWDVMTGKEIRKLWDHPCTVRCLAFSPDGQFLASAGEYRVGLKVWDTQSWDLVHKVPDSTGAVESVVFHPKNHHVLAWGSTDGTVKVWNRATNELRTLRGHTSWVESVAFSPDGEWIASASLDGTVKIWEAPPLQELTRGADK